MRVMVVCQGDLTGASEKQALGFATQLGAAGHDVLLSLRGAPQEPDREAATVPGVGLSWRRYAGPRLAAGTVREAHAFGPELIHAFNPRAAVLRPAAELARVTDAPVCVHWEDDEWSIRRGPSGRSLVRRLGRRGRRLLYHAYTPQGVFVTPAWLRWAVRHAAGFDALTPMLAERVEDELGRECAVILPVMPAIDWSPRPPTVEVPAHRPLVVFTGEIHPGSCEDVMLGLRALALVQRRGLHVGFAHVGASLARYDLARMAHSAGLEPGSVTSLGYVPFPELPPVLQRAAILLQPGRPIDFNRLRLPSKLQAYLASGTPTITFAAGFAELLEDRREVLKTYGETPDELADRIAELLTDADLRATLSAGGPRAAARLFDPVANGEALLAHYRRCLDAAGQGAAPALALAP